MVNWTYDKTKQGYLNLWNKTKIKEGKDFTNATFYANKITAGEKQYTEVEKLTGVPWFFIGALHMRESGCDFKGVLHNGEKIIGKNRKTVLVPAGRGPFSSWSVSAVDALKIKGLEKIKDWNISRMGYEAERFNGLGYVGKKVNSAYLWAGSNQEQTGKYVRDHVWDKNFDDPQIGVMTVIKRLAEMRPDINKRINPTPPVTTTQGGITSVIAGAGAAAAITFWDYWPYIVPGAIVVTISTIVLIGWYNRKKNNV